MIAMMIPQGPPAAPSLIEEITSETVPKTSLSLPTRFMTFATMESIGPITASKAVTIPIITFAHVAKPLNFSISSLIFGIALSLKNSTILVMIGAKAVANSVLKDRKACFKA